MPASAKHLNNNDARLAGIDGDPSVSSAEQSAESAIVDAVGGGQRVLELRVGDAGAGLATVLQAKHGCTVVTRDLHPNGEDRAASHHETDNHDQRKPDQGATHGEFTVVIADDVLPQMIDPLAALRAAERELAPMGRVVVAVPNFGHADVSLALAEGHFRYADSGLLDRRHLRWFTLASLVGLIRESGLEPVSLQRVRVSVGETEVGETVAPTPLALAAATVDADADTYRFVVVAQRSADIADVQEHAAAFDAEQRELRARHQPVIAARLATLDGGQATNDRRAVTPDDAADEIAALRQELAAAADAEAEARTTVNHLNHYMATICQDNGFDPEVPLADSMAEWAARQVEGRADDQHAIDRQEGELIRLRTLLPGPSWMERLTQRIRQRLHRDHSDR